MANIGIVVASFACMCHGWQVPDSANKFERDSALAGLLLAAAPALSRRKIMSGAAVAAAFGSPLAAVADGAGSPATRLRARSLYGSRIFRLQGKAPFEVLEEKNALELFATNGFRQTPQLAEITGLKNKVLDAATKGDSDATQAALKELIAAGKITGPLDGEYFNPKLKRSSGDPWK
mmetsp:Transcript_28641/g.45498  ORF Transcript_28641/g.45498 Transcript_28641/m.45498 type:complete len:177 (-) Transcript_28641:121-651(-)